MQLVSSPDITQTVALLERANLPTADVTPQLLELFIGISNDAVLEGVIGYEGYDRAGLLRSLVVAPSARGLGFARRLIEHIETLARENGVRTLYLLTTDADDYFAKHGYQSVSRSEVPASIQATAQFSSLCPGSATAMAKAL